MGNSNTFSLDSMIRGRQICRPYKIARSHCAIQHRHRRPQNSPHLLPNINKKFSLAPYPGQMILIYYMTVYSVRCLRAAQLHPRSVVSSPSGTFCGREHGIPLSGCGGADTLRGHISVPARCFSRFQRDGTLPNGKSSASSSGAAVRIRHTEHRLFSVRIILWTVSHTDCLSPDETV